MAKKTYEDYLKELQNETAGASYYKGVYANEKKPVAQQQIKYEKQLQRYNKKKKATANMQNLVNRYDLDTSTDFSAPTAQTIANREISAPIYRRKNANIPISPVETIKSNKRELTRQTEDYNKNIKGSKELKEYNKYKNVSKPSEGSWLNLSNFEDGYDFGDITKSILGTATNVAQDFTKSAQSNIEGVLDWGANTLSGATEYFGDDKTTKALRKWAQKDFIEDKDLVNKTITRVNPVLSLLNTGLKAKENFSDGYNVGDVSKTLLGPVQSETLSKEMNKMAENSILGEKSRNITRGLGQLAGQAALKSVGVPWQVTAFTNSAGSEMNNAFQNNSSFGQAFASGLISGLVEVGTEKIGSGANKMLGMTSLGSKTIDKLGSKISNKVVSRLLKMGIDAGSEGLEEVLSGLGTAYGQQLTYMSDKELKELYSSEQALDDFIGGALVSGIANIPGNVQSIKRGENAFSGLTENEQKVLDKELNNRIQEQQNDGKKLSQKEIDKIEDQVRNDMAKGRISVETIEETLGGNNTTQNDVLLQNSYNERTNRSVAYNADLSKYKGKQKEIVQKAIDSGVLNNTNRSHEMVDLVAKLAEDKGMDFDFVNNEKLKNTGFALEGKQVNGYNTGTSIGINIDSNKALNSVIGHEITHVLEGTELYNELQKSIMEYAKTKGEYDTRLKDLQELYKDVKDANVENELTSDLVGDYLFTDEDFVNRLYNNNRNVFQKIYDEIKYFVKQVAPGSKEAKQLEQVKRAFEKVYNQKSTNVDNTLKYSTISTKGAKNLQKNSNNSRYNNLYSLLKTAKEISNQSKSGLEETNKKLKKETQWFKTKYGDWGTLISDKDAKITKKLEPNKTYKLGDIFEHDILYKAYPGLENLRVKTIDFGGETGKAGYRPVKFLPDNVLTNDIVINNDWLDKSDFRRTLLHEINHFIEGYEKFNKNSRGANSKELSIDEYRNNLGEIISNETKILSNLTQEQLDNILLLEQGKENPSYENIKEALEKVREIDNKKGDKNVIRDNRQISEFKEKNKKQVVKKNTKLDSDGNTLNKNQELDNSSFSLDKNAKRYDDLTKANYIEYFLKDNGDVRIYLMDSNNNLVNQLDLYNQREAINQLGEELGKQIYQSSSVDNQRIDIGNDINNMGTENDYFMTHRPTETGITADDLTKQGYEVELPKDIYEHPEYYSVDKTTARETMNQLNRARNNPDADITIYRATTGDKINKGDWVTLSKSYAEQHNNSQFDGKGNIIEKVVKAKDIQHAGDALEEWGYFPTTNDDIRYSLSEQNKKIAPVGNYQIKGKDVKLPKAKETKLKIPTKADITTQTKTKNVNIPLAKKDNVIKVNANKIAKQINETGGFDVKQRSWATTSTESDVLKDKVYIEDLNPNEISYVVQSNKKSLDKANNKINALGYEGSINHAKELLNSEKLPTASDVAFIQRMIQESSKKGDYETTQNLIMDAAILGTDLGQATQALSIIQKLTPEGQLKLYTKMVQRAKVRGEKSFQNVEITPEMVKKVLDAYNADGTFDQNDLNSRVESFKQDIADQMKTTVGEKIDAWRYLSMLGNPKTHIRNIVSNVAMKGTIKVKNAMARTLETLLPVKERTKTWKKTSNDIKNYAEQTANEMKGIITGENKYNEKSSIESKKQIFKNKALEKISDFNSNALEAEDWFFSKRAFRDTLQEYLTANDINTLEDIKNNPELVEKAKNYAVEQAEIATFRQYSKLAATINRLESKNKLARFALEATIPFKKTPINVAKAGVNYSPLGLIKNITYDAYQLKQGNINASQFIDNISQGMTGTSLAVLGYALAKAGILSGSGGDDKDDKYDKQLGNKGYSVNVGGNSYSISWLSPVAMPLLVGANAYEQLEEEKEWDMNVVSESLAKTLDPLNEMSFMQGVTNALQSYGSGPDKIKGSLESVGQNYISQFFPTLFSQIASVTDDTKRSTQAANNSKYKFGEQTVRNIMYKIPGLRNQLEPITDIWGNEKKQSDSILERAFESFISPYSKTEKISTELDDELKRVYKETGETKVIPGIPYGYVKYDDETYRMSAKDYTEFKKTYGQTANETLNDLINSFEYQSADDEDKVKMIDAAYDYARSKAKEEYFDKNDVDYEDKLLDKLDTLESEFGIDASDYITNKKGYDYAYRYPSKYRLITQIADYDDYNEYKEQIQDIRDNTKKDKQETIKYINSLKMNVPQKAMFIKKYYKSYHDYDNEIIKYINSQRLSAKEKQQILEELGFKVVNGRVYNK